jgi:hypothetical protein
VPPPNLSLLDAPDRESCTLARGRSNTPLAALVLLNDTTFVEASRKLAERVLGTSGPDDRQRISRLFELVLARPPTEQELTLISRELAAERAAFRRDAAAVTKLLAVGESPADPRLNPVELAAWSMAASVVLNLDEAMSLR